MPTDLLQRSGLRTTLESSVGFGTRLSDSHSGAQSKERGSFGKDNRQCRVRSEHTTLAVATERHNDDMVMCVEMLGYVLVESEASSQASGTLRHRGAGDVKNSERQHVRFTQ